MTRATKAQKSERLNAAYGLLAQGHDVTAAVTLLSQRFDLSQRQAYRYVQVASNMSQSAPIHEALVPITMKFRAVSRQHCAPIRKTADGRSARLSRQRCQSSCPAPVAMVERVAGKQRTVELDHAFDRLFPVMLCG